jgi:hypothetical protein
MTIELVIGNAVPKKMPTNVWKLDITYMHGDADLYTDNTIMKEDEAEATKMVEALMLMQRCEQHTPKRFETQFKKHAALIGLSPEQVTKYLDDFAVGDRTTDGSTYAAISSIKVTYFNKEGVEFQVKAVKVPK